MKTKKTQPTYSTTNFYLSCFLLVRGIQLVGLNQTEDPAVGHLCLFKETCHKFLSKINDPKIVTERLKKDIIKLVIDEVVIEGESVKIFATIPLPNKIHEREMDKTDIPGTFNAGATLGPVNETNMTRIWNKHKINTALKPKVFVAMSGGVDSSVAAKLLKDQGYRVAGIFLHFWKETAAGRGDFENKCCSAQALLDARRVAHKIGLPLYTLNFVKIFKKQVVDNFLAEYGRGQTPNPCVRCNKLVKLGFLIKQAKKLGFDYVASGHYVKRLRVRSRKLEVKYKLLKAKDKNKDQSYFLYTLSQKELARLLFPLGDYTKPQVRQMAKKFKLPVAEKAESQEICFIEGKDHNEFLKRHLKLNPGPIVILERSPRQDKLREAIESYGVRDRRDSIGRSAPSRMTANKTVGAHQGLPLYTIGQRKGLKIGGSGPFYTAKMDYKKNILYVVNRGDHPLLYKSWLIAKNVNWLAGSAPKLPLKCQAVIRYHHQAAECVISKMNNRNFKVQFLGPQRAITPGQSVVFYQGKEVLGGGVIV